MKPVLTTENGLWKITDKVNSGYGSVPEFAYQAYQDAKAETDSFELQIAKKLIDKNMAAILRDVANTLDHLADVPKTKTMDGPEAIKLAAKAIHEQADKLNGT